MTRTIGLDDGWALWPQAPLRGAGMPVDWLRTLASDGTEALRGLLRQPAFLAALAWQNPGVAGWAARPDCTLTAYRAGVLARYAQRYCAKNDSIGFFGPVGWAELVAPEATAADDGARLAVTGSGGVRRSEVCLELWAVREVAQAFQADERVRPMLPVRLNPAVHDDGEHLHRPFRPPLPVDAATRRVLARVDGVRTVGQVYGDDADAGARLERDGVLSVGWRVPPCERPEVVLREQVAALPDTDVRTELLAELDGLEVALAEVAKVFDRPAGLIESLAGLDQRFATVTGAATTRTKHEAGSGRTVAYLDCRRDLDVRVPAGLHQRLAAPLALLLRSARWLTAETGDAAEEHLTRAHAALARTRDRVRLSDLYLACADFLSGAPGTAIHDIAADFRLRWTEVLGSRAGRLDSRELEPLVRGLFPADEPGWAAARQHSPDLMLVTTAEGSTGPGATRENAPRTGATREGLTGEGPCWVLGELHVAMNTLESRFFQTLHDDADVLAELTARDMSGGRIVPCYPYSRDIDSRRYPPLAVHVPDRYLYWSHSDDMGAPAGVRPWPATALTVRRERGELVAGPEGGWALPAREFFGEFLSALVVNRFQLPAPGPRLALDDLVIRRATWHLRVDELPAGVLGSRGYRPDVLADRLAAEGLPRHLFARIPGEPKPFYVDLHAPLLVTNLARSWRRAQDGPVELQEMLPGPDDLWLRDPSGRRYTTEFRMVAVDGTARTLPGLERLP